MTQISNCPSKAELHQLLDNQLSALQELQLVEHVDACVKCQKRLDQLTEQSWPVRVEPEINLSTDLPNELGRVLKSLSHDYTSASSDTAFELIESAFQSDAAGIQLTERIGQGGMGVVMKGIDRALQRWVALKFMAPMWEGDSGARQRFLREARAAAGATHPNIVTIHSVTDCKPYPYLVMEFVDGPSLQTFVNEKKGIHYQQVIEFSRQIASGLAAAHEKKVIHRDIKPENILLDAKSKQIKITDFGLARVIDESRLTQTGVLVGTPGFQAPEIFEGESAVDERCDLFSLGCVMYFMCTGVSPFRSDSLLTSMRLASKGSYRRLQDWDAKVPTSLSSVVEKLLQPHKKDRIQTACEIESRLNNGDSSAPVLPPPVSRSHTNSIHVQSEKPKPATRILAQSKNSIPVVLAFAIGTLVFVGCILIAAQWLQKRETETESERAEKTAPGENPENDKTKIALKKAGELKKKDPAKIPASNAPENVFVLESPKKSPRTFRQLKDALEEAGDGDTIVIDTKDSLQIFDSVNLSKNICIRSRSENRVAIDLFLDEDESDADLEDERFDQEEWNSFLKTSANLKLEGFEIRFHNSEENLHSLVHQDSGRLELVNCLIRSQADGALILGGSEEPIQLTDCEIVTPNGCLLEIIEESTRKNIELKNCLFAGSSFLRKENERLDRVDIERCTFVIESFIEIFGELDSLDGPLLEVVATKCALATEAAVIGMESTEDFSREQFLRLIKWRGDKNLYTRPVIQVSTEDSEEDERPVSWCQNLEDWETLFQETNSSNSHWPFELSSDLLREKIDDRTINRLDFELKKRWANVLGAAASKTR